jgi:hypothetical protein
MKYLSHGSQRLAQDSNLGPPEPVNVTDIGSIKGEERDCTNLKARTRTESLS